MIQVFQWFKVRGCMPESPKHIETDEHGIVTEWTELNPEFIHRIRSAMHSGELNVYNKDGVLLGAPQEVDDSHYLYPKQVNEFFLKKGLPYEWNPSAKFDAKPILKDLINNRDLEHDSIDAANRLKDTGTDTRHINVEAVAKELIKFEKYSRWAISTLESKIRVDWFKHIRCR